MNLRYAKRSEDTEQITVVSWVQWNKNTYPELKLLHHCPNGGSRNKAEAIKLKQMGVVAGIPDLCLPVPKGTYAGLYIEMKYDKGTIRPNQKEVLRELAEAGHYAVVCYGANEAINVLKEYCELKAIDTGAGDNVMSQPNLSVYKEGKVRQL